MFQHYAMSSYIMIIMIIMVIITLIIMKMITIVIAVVIFTAIMCRHNHGNSSTDSSNTVSFHNFKSRNFKLSVSNPKSKYVAYVSVLSQISNCQGLGRKNKHEILKTDRTGTIGLVRMSLYESCTLTLYDYTRLTE